LIDTAVSKRRLSGGTRARQTVSERVLVARWTALPAYACHEHKDTEALSVYLVEEREEFIESRTFTQL